MGGGGGYRRQDLEIQDMEVGGLALPPPLPLSGIKDMLHADDLLTYCLFSQLRIVFHFQLQKKKKKKKAKNF